MTEIIEKAKELGAMLQASEQMKDQTTSDAHNYFH